MSNETSKPTSENEIEKAIRETLVIDNPQSIGIAVDKIMKLNKPHPTEARELPDERTDELMTYAEWFESAMANDLPSDVKTHRDAYSDYVRDYRRRIASQQSEITRLKAELDSSLESIKAYKVEESAYVSKLAQLKAELESETALNKTIIENFERANAQFSDENIKLKAELEEVRGEHKLLFDFASLVKHSYKMVNNKTDHQAVYVILQVRASELFDRIYQSQKQKP